MNPVVRRLAAIEAKADTHLFGYRRDPATGAFVKDDGSEVGASDYAKSGAKVAATAGAIGAGAVAAKAAHRAVMSGYGGEGGVGQAYRNAGRNALEGVKTAAAGVPGRARAAAQSVRGAVTDAASRGAKAYGNARQVAGMGVGASAGRAIKKAVNPLLSRLRKVTGFEAGETVGRLHALAEKVPGAK